jgi:uncharacterized protein YfaS (alpha-2-macroglobulin family)
MVVFDVNGREIETLVDQPFSAGYHAVTWRNAGSVGTGLYFVRLRFDEEDVTHKVVVSR